MDLRLLALCIVAAFPTATKAQDSKPAQQATDEPAASDETPIVVLGEHESERRRVITGSRVPRRPLAADRNIATNTGVPGLTPGSGMDPMGQYSRTITRRSCKSDDPGIGERAACVIADANMALESGDKPLAMGLLKALERDEDSNAREKFVAARQRFQLASAAGDRAAMADSLETLIESGELPDTQANAARRKLDELRS